MSNPSPPSGLFDRNKKSQRRTFHSKQDAYWCYGRLMHDAEVNHMSVERLLYVMRLALTHYTDILRPSEEFEDVPVHFLGSHLLTFRGIENTANGFEDRLLVQEICSLDAKEEPRERNYPGIELARLSVSLKTESYTTRENLLSMQALLKVELNGEGIVTFPRHKEDYTFNFPKIVFHQPLSEECPLSLKGKIDIKCPATGLAASLILSSDGGVKGAVKRLAGSGSINICTIYGRWDDKINVTNTEKGTQGVLFAADDIKPAISTQINLSNIASRRLHRFWTMLHDTLIYVDSSKSKSKAGEKLCVSLRDWMKSLMPDSVVITPASIANLDGQSESDTDSESSNADTRNVPPCIKEAHRYGKKAVYRLECRLISLDRDDLTLATSYIPDTAAASLTEYWQKQTVLKTGQTL